MIQDHMSRIVVVLAGKFAFVPPLMVFILKSWVAGQI